jgi:hypothetical protein
MSSESDIELKRLKTKEENINRVINRYMRIRRKSFFRKILYLGLRSN